MSNKPVPYQLAGVAEGTFKVPFDWKSCGPGLYISGDASKLEALQPIAVALTAKELILCTQDGPVWAIPVKGIRDVEAREQGDILIPTETAAGTRPAVLPNDSVVVSYKATTSGAVGRLEFYTGSRLAALDWVNDIRRGMSPATQADPNRPGRR